MMELFLLWAYLAVCGLTLLVVFPQIKTHSGLSVTLILLATLYWPVIALGVLLKRIYPEGFKNDYTSTH